MQRTCAYLYFEFATDFVLHNVFEILLLIFYSSDQRTALHIAAYFGHTAMCELLIASKADVDAKDRCAFIL
jgi:ankyrin repeat protein